MLISSVLNGQHKYNSELKSEILSSKLEHSSQRALKVSGKIRLFVRKISRATRQLSEWSLNFSWVNFRPLQLGMNANVIWWSLIPVSETPDCTADELFDQIWSISFLLLPAILVGSAMYCSRDELIIIST